MKANKIAAISLIVSIISIIVAIIIGIASNKSSFDIAEKSGVFERPKVDPFLGQIIMKPNQKIHVVFGIDPSIDKDDSIISSVPIGLHNSGEKRAKNITVTYRYHKLFMRKPLEALEFVGEGMYPSKNVKKYFSSLGDFDYVAYRIPELDTGLAISIKDPLYLQETNLLAEFNNEKFDLSYKLNYFLKFSFSVSAEGINHSDYEIIFEVVHAKSLQGLKDYIAKDRGPKEVNNLRKKTTFIEYLGLLFRETEQSIILIYPELKKVKAGTYFVYANQGDDFEISTLTYDTVQLNKLFD